MAPIIAGRDAPPVFQSAEHDLDAVAAFVAALVVVEQIGRASVVADLPSGHEKGDRTTIRIGHGMHPTAQCGPETALTCETHVRYGYRRVYYILRRDGWAVDRKKVYRLYRELGLQLRNKPPKRRVKAKLREDHAPAIRPNDVWAMGFVHDQLATGRKLHILTVVDTFSRLSPVVDPRFSYRGEDVVATLERACREIGYPPDTAGKLSRCNQPTGRE